MKSDHMKPDPDQHSFAADFKLGELNAKLEVDYDATSHLWTTHL
jgi:hypothetical protein